MAQKRKKSRRSTSGGNRLFVKLLAVAAIAILLVAGVLYASRIATGEAGFSWFEKTDDSPIRVENAQLLTVAMPSTVDSQNVEYTGYAVSFNPTFRIPNYVAYELTRSETKGNAKRAGSFKRDANVENCPKSADYTRSGYDRGHMAPAADMKWSEQAMRESFYMTNICPQFPALNRGGWKQLEDKVRDWAIRDSAIIVITGPVVGDAHKTIAGDIAVPDAFFKVLLAPSEGRGIAFVYQNAGGQKTIARQAVSIDSVETLTGFDFFRALPDDIENRIEQSCDYNEWNN